MTKYILVFITFSFLGWVWESIYCTICQKKWANRGFLYGPVCPIYGFACCLGLTVFELVEKGAIPSLSWWQILLMGIIASAVIEYVTSLVLEKIFHARWWDYSYLPLNLNGRISLPTAVAFGFAAILVMKVLLPCFSDIYAGIPAWLNEFLSFLFISVISADLTLTVSALTDFQSRVKAVDESFQNNMTENVYKIMARNNRIRNHAISRIAKFKYSKKNDRHNEIAKRLKEKKLDELINDFFGKKK